MNPENSQPEIEKQQNEKLLRLMTGYNHYASCYCCGSCDFFCLSSLIMFSRIFRSSSVLISS